MAYFTRAAIESGTVGSAEQPVIEGDGVLLRPWTLADAGAVVEAYADPGIQKWHCRSMEPDEARAWIEAWPGEWRAERGASWAIEADGRAVGQIGLRRLDLYEALASVSYWIKPEARGRGLAPSALTALGSWSFGSLGLHRLQLAHSAGNAASCRVAVKAGFAAEGTRRSSALHADGWHDMHVHARIAGDVAGDPAPVVP